nr:MAG TPA: zinc finger homeobox protein 4 [Caudoviricetes sp.]
MSPQIIIVTGLYVDYCTLCSRKYKKNGELR